MPAAALLNQVLLPVLLLAVIVFFARRSMLWMLVGGYRNLRELRIRLTIKMQVWRLMLERRLAYRQERPRR